MSSAEMVAEKVITTKREVNWLRVLVHIQIFIFLCFGIHYIAFQTLWKTLFYSLFLIVLTNLGLTAGAHRLWAHKSYKAAIGVKVFLMLCHTLGGTGSIYNWVKIHRLHHKYFGTDLDPYNPSKGFFYAHFTSFCLDLSPAQEKALEEIDMSDLESDKIVMFQKKYVWLIFAVLSLFVINAPAEYWDETLNSAAYVVGLVRLSISFHLILLVHSATKILGLEPGEKYPSDTNLVFIMTKNYWLSYHYMIPWDYQTGEYGSYGTDFATKFIRVCEALDYASDLQVVDSKTIRTALVQSVDSKRPIAECIHEMHSKKQFTKDQFFLPAKFL